MRFRVKGLDRETAEPREIQVDAISPASAIEQASNLGVMVETAQPVGDAEPDMAAHADDHQPEELAVDDGPSAKYAVYRNSVVELALLTIGWVVLLLGLFGFFASCVVAIEEDGSALQVIPGMIFMMLGLVFIGVGYLVRIAALAEITAQRIDKLDR